MNEQLKNLVWELDRRIWASVTNGEATASWGRQESAKMIEEYASEQNAQLRKELELCQTGNADLRLECELLRKEVEELKKSVTPDPFLYPINSAKLKELVWKLDREIWAKVEAKEATTSWGREQTSFLISQYFGQSSNELTRLRELLRRAKEFIPFVYINGEPERHTSDCKYPYTKCRCHLEQLLTEIDNALNPVYSPPYIEGKTDLQNEG